jgi:hypothetical protein
MHPDLDFKALRAQVEAATRVPDFGGLWRRARRIRIRDRLAVFGAMLGTFVVFTPVAVASLIGRNNLQPSPISPDTTSIDQLVPTASTSVEPKMTVVVRAAGGTLPEDLFAAVDVCVEEPGERRCNLQVTAIRTGEAKTRVPFVLNALRDTSTDKLLSVDVAPLSTRAVLLSGVLDGKPRVFLRITPDGATSPETPAAVLALGPGDRPFQLADAGEIYGVRQHDGAFSKLDQQPRLTQRTVVTSVPPERGWWVSGADPDTGAPGVAVSRDQGRQWMVRSLAAPPGQLDVPTLATHDGITVHAYIRYSTGIRQFRTNDGGLTWAEVAKRIELPGVLASHGALAGRRFGAVARADRSVLLWIEDTTVPVFLNSTDGESFTLYTGPSAAVVAVDGGYVTLGEAPRISLDCMNWAPAAMAAPVQPR